MLHLDAMVVRVKQTSFSLWLFWRLSTKMEHEDSFGK